LQNYRLNPAQKEGRTPFGGNGVDAWGSDPHPLGKNWRPFSWGEKTPTGTEARIKSRHLGSDVMAVNIGLKMQ